MNAPAIVERIRAPSASRFRREFADTGRPVVLTGAVASWPALSRWTFEWFAERYGELTVPVQRWTMQTRFDAVEHEQMALANYLDRIRTPVEGVRLHLSGHCLLRDAPELWADIAVPPYVNRLGDDQPFVFFSGAGTVTPLHHDLCHNFYAQVRGTKRFVLFSPPQRFLLHAPAPWRRDAWTSPVDVDAPNFDRYPGMRWTRPREAVLEPGDVLFLPGGWWHAVRTLDDGIAVSFFWEHGFRQRAVRALLRVMGRPAT